MRVKGRSQSVRIRRHLPVLLGVLVSLFVISLASAGLTRAKGHVYPADRPGRQALDSPAAGILRSSRADPDPCDWSGQGYEDFYDPPELGDPTAERLGELLRVEYIDFYSPEEVASIAGLPSSPYGAHVYRVLYLSQMPLGTARAVSGFMVMPSGTVPVGGFPVISHGHETKGMADQCAPSKKDRLVSDLLHWVAQGYVVSATDYMGLGTPGLHHYAVGEAAAYSMLDGARAGLRFCDHAQGMDEPPAANQIILEGYSEGGHAALFAQEFWQTYAPDLALVGTVTFAPGSELRLLTQYIVDGTSTVLAPVVMAMYAHAVYYGDPTDPGEWLQEPYASEAGDKIEDECLVPVAWWLRSGPEVVYQPDILAAVTEGRWDDLEPFTTYMDINTPGNDAGEVPVLVLHGEDDRFVPVDLSQRLTERLSEHGTPVHLSRYEGVGHFGIVAEARDEAIQWMADRLNEFQFGAFLPIVSR